MEALRPPIPTIKNKKKAPTFTALPHERTNLGFPKMPPFAGSALQSTPLSWKPSDPQSNIVTLNVGGQIFQTTPQTLAAAGPKSLLASPPPFIDRDPHLFSLLLSLLRSGHLPKTNSVSLPDLIAESKFYGLSPLLLSSLSSATQFDPFALRRSRLLPLPGRDSPSSLAPDSSGSLLVAHGSKITSFDQSLNFKSTILTQFPVVDSLYSLSPSLAAAGATDFPGLQILGLSDHGSVKKTLHWAPHPSAATSATVQAIGASPDHLFTSFESSRRNSSAIVAFDRVSLRPVAELARGDIFGAELDSAIPATKLKWVSGFNLLFAAGSHGGPSGLVGNVRLWDVRSPGKAVWDLKEGVADCFADVTVSDNLSAVFKVGVNSGEVFMADLRMLSKEAEDPWVCIGEGRRIGVGKKEGSGCRVESYGNQVFVSRGGEVEMWSEVVMGSAARRREDGLAGEGRVMRRNLMGRAKDVGGKRIVEIGFGGNRMVVARKEEQCVEVWDSSTRW